MTPVRTPSLVPFIAERTGLRETHVLYQTKDGKTGKYYTTKLTKKELEEIEGALKKLTPREQQQALSVRDTKAGKNAFDYFFSVSYGNELGKFLDEQAIKKKDLDQPVAWKPTTGEGLPAAVFEHYTSSRQAMSVSDLVASCFTDGGEEYALFRLMLSAYKDDKPAFINEVLLAKNSDESTLLDSIFKNNYVGAHLAFASLRDLKDDDKRRIIFTENHGKIFFFHFLQRFHPTHYQFAEEALGKDIFRLAMVHHARSDSPYSKTPMHFMMSVAYPIQPKIKYICDELKRWQKEWESASAKEEAKSAKDASPFSQAFTTALDRNLLHLAAERKDKDAAAVITHLCETLSVKREMFLDHMRQASEYAATTFNDDSPCYHMPLHVAALSKDPNKLKAFCDQLSVAEKFMLYRIKNKRHSPVTGQFKDYDNVLHIIITHNDLPCLRIILEDPALDAENKRCLLEVTGGWWAGVKTSVFLYALYYGSRAMVELIADTLGPKGLRKEYDAYRDNPSRFLRALELNSSNIEFKVMNQDAREAFLDHLFKTRLALYITCNYVRDRVKAWDFRESRKKDAKDRLDDFVVCFRAAKTGDFPSDKDTKVNFEKGEYADCRKLMKDEDRKYRQAEAEFLEGDLKCDHPNSDVTRALFPGFKAEKANKKDEGRKTSPPPSPRSLLPDSMGGWIKSSKSDRSAAAADSTDVDLSLPRSAARAANGQ